jgi:hypothetical protein
MPQRKYSVEQILAKLREAEKLRGERLTIAQVCKRLEILNTGPGRRTLARTLLRAP